jgi:hypothetical protein
MKQEIFYPESDGKPMGETEDHVNEIVDLLTALKRRYRDVADVYVGADMFLYYVEGNPGCCVCPDVFLTVGIPKKPERRSYFLWREGRPPSMVIEGGFPQGGPGQEGSLCPARRRGILPRRSPERIPEAGSSRIPSGPGQVRADRAGRRGRAPEPDNRPPPPPGRQGGAADRRRNPPAAAPGRRAEPSP